MADKREKATTPLGLVLVGEYTEGSSSVATLGFGAESLWDSYREFPKGIKLNVRVRISGLWISDGGEHQFAATKPSLRISDHWPPPINAITISPASPTSR